ncbi:MAG: Tim44 domain-containing protein [Alphaproteobacteria bacterium]|nr:Tim44 domain-containing protein [Alphaproteobacteria bacterium]MCB1551024.1 Tim44 domain-containing protein [Alphaproteobacteria bacterium]MCB9985850.1 Tim44 domain-containing protein [Micavibrio sp.]HPQ50162.1 Tim44/TimA family putative adaptor protein [Alphaproteobacteria bacterium]HRK97517.1 Tim44/TimA family putative adaptor protein [Alphaproteobacteria bacterium]
MPADLLIYIVIAAVMIFWLRNTLGNKHGDEQDRSDIAKDLQDKIEGKKSESLSHILGQIKDHASETDENNPSPIQGIKVSDTNVAESLIALIRDIPDFDPPRFITGAKDAFAMIVESFARADLATLKDLLSKGVFHAFEQEINDRAMRGETVITDIHAVKSAEILDITRIERMAFIKIRFIAEETCVVKDREGNILSGNPDKITIMNDVWTFGRDIKAKDPTWFLYETADDEAEEHKTPIPDAS